MPRRDRLEHRSRSSPRTTCAVAGSWRRFTVTQHVPSASMFFTHCGSCGPPPLVPQITRSSSTSKYGSTVDRSAPDLRPMVVSNSTRVLNARRSAPPASAYCVVTGDQPVHRTRKRSIGCAKGGRSTMNAVRPRDENLIRPLTSPVGGARRGGGGWHGVSLARAGHVVGVAAVTRPVSDRNRAAGCGSRCRARASTPSRRRAPRPAPRRSSSSRARWSRCAGSRSRT